MISNRLPKSLSGFALNTINMPNGPTDPKVYDSEMKSIEDTNRQSSVRSSRIPPVSVSTISVPKGETLLKKDYSLK